MSVVTRGWGGPYHTRGPFPATRGWGGGALPVVTVPYKPKITDSLELVPQLVDSQMVELIPRLVSGDELIPRLIDSADADRRPTLVDSKELKPKITDSDGDC
jgi:hypothetical protein